jgi:S1-C subfamily serine protease
MSTDNNIWVIAERYESGSLNKAEQELLNARLQSDTAYRIEFEEALALIRSLQQRGAQEQFRQSLTDIHSKLQAPNKRRRFLNSEHLRTASVAAGVALLTSIGTSLLHSRHQEDVPRYSELRKVKTELEGIKQSQSRIIRDLDNKANKPPIENKYSGTGFALSNDGYVVTNYHVTEGADSVYIQTRNGDYYKAATVSFDAQADIAILKVESGKFRFSKQQNSLPYTFASGKKSLGERIYTLGYPQDEIVYNEGYISSKNGFLGDSMQYRLDLPAEPGQSGAPVVDASGTIIGIISGKDPQSGHITYAVSSNTLLRMLRNIPQGKSIVVAKNNKLTGLSREKQIEKLQEFTCVVNVYK